MSEEKKEAWMNWMALTTVIFAVCATLATLKGGGYSSRAVLSQNQATDQWAFYQSKSLKGYLFDLQRESLELEVKKGAVGGAALAEYRSRIQSYAEKVKKYEEEKAEIKKNAERLEQLRNDSLKHSGSFGYAAMFLQLAILLSSIAALMKRSWFWYFGTALGGLGLVFFVNGWFGFFDLLR